ncbi:MAG: protein kinase [Planctomycetota bacterium]|nr:protein kinase [Planctomycetota bacterium]
MPESVPQVVANCKILSKLGQGGMGSVYKAVHTTLGRSIALKVLPTEFTRSPEYVARFMREARAVANLSHPNIVGVHDAGEQNGIYYIAMEMVDGASMGALTRHYRPLSEIECLNFLLQAARGMAAAHARGLVHRDIKPENMLVSREGYLKIVDFGLVLEQSSDSHLTRTGTFLGTPVYMSPEQCDGDVADARSDLYSLGATFFSLLTGKPPFQAPTALGILYKHKFEQPPDPKSLVPDLTEHTGKILLKMLQKKREERYQNAQELIEDVEKAQKAVVGKENTWSLKDALGTIKAPTDTPLEFAATPSPNAAYTPTVMPGTYDPRTGGPSTSGGRTPAYSPGSTPAPVAPSGFEPTMMAGQYTPAQNPQVTAAGQGFEPTLLTAGRSPAPQASGATPAPLNATPAPTPLQEMNTPAGSQGAGLPKASKLPLILGGAAAAVLVLGVGGYLGFENFKKSQQLTQAKTNIEQFIQDGNLEKAERERKNALVKFSDDSDLLGFQAKIVERFKKRFATELDGDPVKADETLKSFAMIFPDEDVKALQNELLEKYVSSTKQLIDERKTEDAKRLLFTATRTFPNDPRLFKMNDALVRSSVAADLRFGDTIKAGKDAMAKRDFAAAEAAYAEAAKLKAGDPELEASLRKPLYDHFMELSAAAEKGANWPQAIAQAKLAAPYGPTEQRIATLERRAKIELLRKDANALYQGGDWRGASAKLLEAAMSADEKLDAALKTQLNQQSQGWKKEGFEKEIKAAEDAKDWEKAQKVITEALQEMGQDLKLQDRLDAATHNFGLQKDFATAVKEGDDLMSQKKWPDARNRFKTALITKQDPEVQTKLGIAETHMHLEAGNAAFAEQDWEKAKASYDAAALASKELDEKNKALKDSVQSYLKQLDEKKAALLAAEQKADQLFRDGKFPEAISVYQQLQKDNKSKTALYENGINAIRREDSYRQLLKNGDEAVKLDDLIKARGFYQNALDKKAGDPDAKAEVELRLKAVTALERFKAGDELYKKSDWRGAQEALEGFLKDNPDAPKATKDKAEGLVADLKKRVKAVDEELKDAEKHLKEGKLLDAVEDYENLAKIDPINKDKYAAALKDLQPKIEAQRKVLEEQKRREDEQRRKDEEAKKAAAAEEQRRQNYTSHIDAAKNYIRRADYDSAKTSANSALQLFPGDKTATDLLKEIEDLKKRRFDQQGETDVWNKVKPLVEGSKYAEAKQEADKGAQAYPAQAAIFQSWSAALTSMAGAAASCDEATRAVDGGRGVTGLPRNAADQLAAARATIASSMDAARQQFLRKDMADAQRRAADAGNAAKATAKNALTSAANTCDAMAAEYAKGGGSGGKRRVQVGETDLPGTGDSGSSSGGGDPAKANECRRAAEALRDLANKLR